MRELEDIIGKSAIIIEKDANINVYTDGNLYAVEILEIYNKCMLAENRKYCWNNVIIVKRI